MAEDAARRQRVEQLLSAARAVTDSRAAEGRELRARLREISGLSRENIELGLTRCLELEPAAHELERLLARTPEAPAAHVLLSGNVFVAALRAIALGVVASSRVYVRASRRDPALAEALAARVPELFTLTPTLAPAPGDHVWAYGSDATLADVRASLPRGVWFHAHGAGFGAVVVSASSWRGEDARAIALDAALFDGHGCLSPRVVGVTGDRARARDIAQELARELAALERDLPLGPRTRHDSALSRRARDAATYAFELFDAGDAWVSYGPALSVPPSGRNLHVFPSADPLAALAPCAASLTGISCNDAELRAILAAAFPGARVVPLGAMQRPALDGPVDLRQSPLGERL